MIKTTPITFIKQIKQELAKVVWPTRNETTITTIMVLILAAIAGVYFLFVDKIISEIIGAILGLR